MNQGLPVAGKEVGLMYSFSSQSNDGFSAPDAAGRDLTRQERKIKADQNGRQCANRNEAPVQEAATKHNVSG